MMKKKLILSFFFVALGFGVVKAQDLPDKKETLKTVIKVNNYFMKKYADYRTPSFVKNVTRPSNIWTRGVYYEGLMALYSVYPRDEYYKYAGAGGAGEIGGGGKSVFFPEKRSGSFQSRECVGNAGVMGKFASGCAVIIKALEKCSVRVEKNETV